VYKRLPIEGTNENHFKKYIET